ncbi:MAG: hypothetical protein HFI75_07325 [Lachnospiraceae bacterium]|nr:hypothetical protein [Lachnospiraceae bacterium]
MRNRKNSRKLHRQADCILGILFLVCFSLLTIINILKKDQSISEEENRALAEKPTITADSLLNGIYMEQYEDYVSDQFAGRNFWRRLYLAWKKAGGSRKENGVFLGKDGQLMEDITAADKEALQKTIDSINAFALRHSDIRTYMLLIPDSAAILTSQLPPHASIINQPEQFSLIKNKMEPAIVWIDAVSALQKHKTEKIYYKTDHHWTSLGAYYSFINAAKSLGIDGDFTQAYDIYPITENFNGVLSSTSGFCQDEQETIYVYLPKENSVSVVAHYVEEQNKRTSLYDTSKLKTKDQYALFLGGNFPLIDIKTSAAEDRKLLLVKDSFANSFIPFLVPFYQEIVVVDPRYYAGTLEEVMNLYEITDMLYLYSGNTFLSDHNISGVLEN